MTITPHDPRRPSRFRSRLGLLATLLAFALATASTADPPPPSNFPIPDVHSFRFTDIINIDDYPQAAGRSNEGPDDDHFYFMFEVLNWTNVPVHGVFLAFNVGTGYTMTIDADPFFTLADIQSDGRPIGFFTGDDANFPPADGTLDDPKVGAANTFTVASSSATAIQFDSLPGIPARDLIGSADSADACSKVPSCTFMAPDVFTIEEESIDNGLAPDNVVDGFIMRIDDFDAGEILSLNYFLLDVNGDPIGSAQGGNGFGYGHINIFRVNSHGPPIWTPSNRTGSGEFNNVAGNTGTIDPGQPGHVRDLWEDLMGGFQVEIGTVLTGDFTDPNDEPPNTGVNAMQIPIPVELQRFEID